MIIWIFELLVALTRLISTAFASTIVTTADIYSALTVSWLGTSPTFWTWTIFSLAIFAGWLLCILWFHLQLNFIGNCARLWTLWRLPFSSTSAGCGEHLSGPNFGRTSHCRIWTFSFLLGLLLPYFLSMPSSMCEGDGCASFPWRSTEADVFDAAHLKLLCAAKPHGEALPVGSGPEEHNIGIHWPLSTISCQT